jgi:hypothetical protein
MPLQMIKNGRLAEWIGKATIFFGPRSGCVDCDFAAKLIAGHQRFRWNVSRAVSPTNRDDIWPAVMRRLDGSRDAELGTILGPVRQPVRQPSAIATAPVDEPDGRTCARRHRR